MDNITDDRLINAIARHTKGDELECDEEHAEDQLLECFRPGDPAEQIARLERLGNQPIFPLSKGE